jgi:hypothetical protein
MSHGSYRYSGRLTVRMPIGLHRELAETAAQQRVSMNQLICVAVAGALERVRDLPSRSDSYSPFEPAPRGIASVGPDFDAIMRSMGYDDHE